MAALTKDTLRALEGRLSRSAQVVNAAAIFKSSFLALVHADHATAGSRGRLRPWTGVANEIPFGVAARAATGDTAAAPPVEAESEIDGLIVRDLAVTGLGTPSATVNDCGKPVYLITTDNLADLTLTRPASPTLPVGFVARHSSSTAADVHLFSATELMLVALMGTNVEEVLLGVVSGNMSGSGNMLQSYTFHSHGAILAVRGAVIQPLTGGGASIDVNLEIASVNVTGGLISWRTTDAQSASLAASAVTALNVYHGGDNLDIEGTVNVAGTGGLLAVFAQLERRFGL